MKSVVLFTFAALHAAAGVALIPHNSTFIEYLGRFDIQESFSAFAWPLSTIRIGVKGTRVSAMLNGGLECGVGPDSIFECGDRFQVVVDGKPRGHPFVVTHSHSFTEYLLADFDEPEGVHAIDLVRISEDNTLTGFRKTLENYTRASGASLFSGFNIVGEAVHYPRPPAKRRLHFIGDSDTAGWCVDGTPENILHSPNRFENAGKTWAKQLSTILKADAVVTAITGIGVHNWPIQSYLDRIVPSQLMPLYDWKTYVPDAVVMMIGPNDHCAGVNDTSFVFAYSNLLSIVDERYRYVKSPLKIVSVCGGSENGLAPCGAIERAHAIFKGHAKLLFTSINQSAWKMINQKEYQGCGGHYNARAHNILAQSVAGDIARFIST